MQDTSRILPRPKDLTTTDGTFTLNAETLLLIPASSGDDALFAVRQLRDEVFQAIGLTLAIVKAFEPPRAQNVVLLACGQEQAVALDVEPVSIGAPEATAPQAYALTVTPGAITLYANESCGLFYAVQTLRQLVRLRGSDLPTLTIRDWPTLPHRGLMLDISRRKVPKLATLKQIVAELGHYKLNVLQLYTEHTFQFPRHTKIGAGCGSLSSEDVMELDVVCRQHHVELMPNLQSFGHTRNTLMLPEYKHLAETDTVGTASTEGNVKGVALSPSAAPAETDVLWTLSPAFEETYALLNELYGDMLPAFSSTTLNVDCDETYDLGRGASKALADEIGVGRVYLNHILRLRKLAARYGRRIQLWGDIMLHYPELIDELPDDVTLLDWHYEPAEEYPSVKVFGEAGRRFWVCPGVGSWLRIFPRLYGSNVNIRNLVRDGVAAGAEGVLNTDWGDHGHLQHRGLSWYGYVFGAVQGWTGGGTSDEDFEAAFGPLFFGPEHRAIMAALHRLASTKYGPDRDGLAQPLNWQYPLFDDPLGGTMVDGEHPLSADRLAYVLVQAESVAATCDTLAHGHPREPTLRGMAASARLIGYAARKVRLGQEIRAGLREIAEEPESVELNDRRMYRHIRALKALDVELVTLRAEFESLWLARARRSEIHVALAYFADLRVRYKVAIFWLKKQRLALLSGKPVDALLSTYDSGDYVRLSNLPHLSGIRVAT